MYKERADLLAIALDILTKQEDKVTVFANGRAKVHLPKHILSLFSPFVARLLSSIPPCQSSCIILPDLSANSLASIGEILENGFTTGITPADEVIEAATLLAINFENLEKIDDSVSNEEIMETFASDRNKIEQSGNASKDIVAENVAPMTKIITIDDTSKSNVEQEEKLLDEPTDELPILRVEQAFSLATTGTILEENTAGEVVILEDENTEKRCVESQLSHSQNPSVDGEVTDVVEDQFVSEQNCKICKEDLYSVETLLYHYCSHFEPELLLKAASMTEGKTCLKCKRTFEELDSVFILHFGLFHSAIIDILKEKNIGNFEIANYSRDRDSSESEKQSRKLPSTFRDPSSNTNVKKCEICLKTGPLFSILHCYCTHFSKEFFTLALESNFVKHKTCQICGLVFSRRFSAIRHVGVTHGKVNILLKQKGLSEIKNVDRPLKNNLTGSRSLPSFPQEEQTNKDQVTSSYEGRMFRKAARVANACEYFISSRTENLSVPQVDTDIVTIESGSKPEPDCITKDEEKLITQSNAETHETIVPDKRAQTHSPSPNPSFVSTGSFFLSRTFPDVHRNAPSPSLSVESNSSSSRSSQVELYLDNRNSSTGAICEVCKKDVKTVKGLLPHYHGHFASQVKRKFVELMNISDDQFSCKLCGHNSNSLQSLVAHLSLTHKKIKEILAERGISVK